MLLFSGPRFLSCLACVLLAYANCSAVWSGEPVPKLERIQISKDRSGFEHAESGRPFYIWGVNYDHDSVGEGRLLEDYWIEEWPTVVEDIREIKSLGANVIRIHLQFAKFMETPDKANESSLKQLSRLLELAEQTGIYLDLTGLGCYHKKDVPEWYDRMNETNRWDAQAKFWSAVAQTCRKSPAVFCYDLMNEPVIGGGKTNDWLAGELGGKYFVQRITLDTGKRTSPEIAKAWVEKLTGAIRQMDPDHLITVGIIPWALTWPTAKPIFYAPEPSKHLDFVSVHFYPNKGEVEKAVTALAVYDIGKPLVIEEMFPLSCSFEEMDEFIQKSRSRAEGFVTFYWGKTVEEYEKENTLQSAIVGKWLKYFREQANRMKTRETAP